MRQAVAEPYEFEEKRPRASLQENGLRLLHAGAPPERAARALQPPCDPPREGRTERGSKNENSVVRHF